MKKILSVFLCAVLVVSAVSFAAADEVLKVAVCFAEALGDLGFNDSAYEGLLKLEEDYGVEGSYVECKTDAGKYLTSLVDAAELNDIVVAVGWQYWDALTEVVPQLPDTLFIFVDNGLDGVGDNLLSIVYAENEGSYLAGYIAMMTSITKTVGFVGGEDYETINNFFVGYRQGAMDADPRGTVLSPVYAGDYESPDKGKELAIALYSAGADVVFAVAGKTGLGVFEAAKEMDTYAIGVDSDQKYIDPEHIICSMVKNIGESIYQAVSQYIEDGTFAGGTIWEADMSTGIISIGYGAEEEMPQQVDDSVKAAVEKLAAKIESGEITVESTR
ncbi:MAG: BMP family ABC transporter substrate-binding protein [Clostridiales bacterium]|nr:BMP family ABC transporter substrate-binding protein [Clostridiales bacterium]